MYLYTLTVLQLALLGMEAVGRPWFLLVTVPPLDLLSRWLAGQVVAEWLILAALYGLVWTALSALLSLWELLSDRGEGETRQSARQLQVSGYSRRGLEPHLWGLLAATPLVITLSLWRGGWGSGGAAVTFFGTALAVAAAQALRPFSWYDDVRPALAALPGRLVRTASAPSERPAPAMVPSGPFLATHTGAARPFQVEAETAPAAPPDGAGEVWDDWYQASGWEGST